MKILLLVIKHQLANLEALYAGIAEQANVHLQRLDSDQQSHLENYFNANITIPNYDRIVFFLRFKQEIRQIGFIRTLPNLVILEHDACQNYFPTSKYYGKFSRHYRDLPWTRILVSGFQVSQRLKAEGHETSFIPKAYDHTLLKNLHLIRDITFGFVGSTHNKLYAKRNELLNDISNQFELEIITTKPGIDYLNALNRIKYFISADIGFDEYMTKNFEAMACGCILVTWNQGQTENDALGFVDMKNVVLYNSIEELSNKLNVLQQDSTLSESIANEGQALVEQNNNCNAVGKRIIDALAPPLKQKPDLSKLDKYKYIFRR